MSKDKRLFIPVGITAGTAHGSIAFVQKFLNLLVSRRKSHLSVFSDLMTRLEFLVARSTGRLLTGFEKA